MTTENMSMDEMMKAYDFNKIYNGQIVKGKVIDITDKEVFVNINYFADGVISKEELSNDIDINPADILKVDDEIDVMIISKDNGEGNVALSKKRVDSIRVWDSIKKAYKEKKHLIIKIKEEVKGGLIAFYKGIRIFMPASQASGMGKIDLKTLIDKDVEVEIIEFDKEKKKVVVSRRVIDEKIKEEKRRAIEEEKKKLWASLRKGEKRNGKVVRLVKFGAFVDIGGIEGLVHNNDLSWKRIVDPSEVVSVGDKVEVFVQDFDEIKGRLSLALKEVDNNPWDNLNGKYKINDIIQGKVVKFMNFGAFVELEPGVEGLVHISEITDENIAKASDVLKIGETIKVKVLDIDEKNHKMSLSIKDAVEKSKDYLKYVDEEEGATLGDILKDKLGDLKL
ncbi:30S ribosomal protein S1 [Clostridium fallax]|uniref:SSU ribosomal protein S1P n=1 Tax=Clostridium fallax TaxID=1533 RepID=A0A1M4VC03_9CLOT|nr:30S ribosomal protein S1 [Clostridium fallax]SHE66423.1 SSU ribosomal protein S1P [Clostridium fallax]SQB05793.1 30S ribosomal protein S1 [Clostridium fallax]